MSIMVNLFLRFQYEINYKTILFTVCSILFIIVLTRYINKHTHTEDHDNEIAI
jgi:hypothetical protein